MQVSKFFETTFATKVVAHSVVLGGVASLMGSEGHLADGVDYGWFGRAMSVSKIVESILECENRGGVESGVYFFTPRMSSDEAMVFEEHEVLADGGLTQAGHLGDLAHGELMTPQDGENFETFGMTQSFELISEHALIIFYFLNMSTGE